jgi:hypothetical protein
VFILLNEKALETPLPNMTAGLVDLVITSDMAGHEPLHPPAQTFFLFGDKRQVKVIRHETVSQHLDGMSSLGLPHEVEKGFIVPGRMKDFPSPIAAVQNMIR